MLESGLTGTVLLRKISHGFRKYHCLPAVKQANVWLRPGPSGGIEYEFLTGLEESNESQGIQESENKNSPGCERSINN